MMVRMTHSQGNCQIDMTSTVKGANKPTLDMLRQRKPMETHFGVLSNSSLFDACGPTGALYRCATLSTLIIQD